LVLIGQHSNVSTLFVHVPETIHRASTTVFKHCIVPSIWNPRSFDFAQNCKEPSVGVAQRLQIRNTSSRSQGQQCQRTQETGSICNLSDLVRSERGRCVHLPSARCTKPIITQDDPCEDELAVSVKQWSSDFELGDRRVSEVAKTCRKEGTGR